MEIYKNRGGDSGVYAYEIGEDYIKVMFTSRKVYSYSYQSAGKDNIERMKELAVYGKGLNSFIMKQVKTLYDR